MPFAHHLPALPADGTLALLVHAGYTNDAEGLAVAPGESVEPPAEGEGVETVGLHPLAAVVPDLRLHHVVAHTHRLELAVQVVAEGPGLVAGVDRLHAAQRSNAGAYAAGTLSTDNRMNRLALPIGCVLNPLQPRPIGVRRVVGRKGIS